MFPVLENASGNVLAEFDSFHEADQRRIQIVGMNPMLAEHIEVVDLDAVMDEYSASTAARAEAQPA